MSSITALGAGSGLDIRSLVDELVAAEADPVNKRLDRREAGYQAQISGLGTLKSALSDLKAVVEGLENATSFKGMSATSSNPERFTATASEEAAAGTFSIQVKRLASAHKLQSDGFADGASVVGTGTLNFSVGGTAFSVTLDESSNTLSGIRDAINTASNNSGVSATIVNVNDPESGLPESHLILTSEKPGASSAMTVTIDDDDGSDGDGAGLSQLTMSLLQEAEDAEIAIDGLTVTRSSNSIQDAIEGVTIELISAIPLDDTGEPTEGPTNLTLASDHSGAGEAINGFVESYNALVDVFQQVARYNADTGEAGSLFGDSAVRNTELQLRSLLGSRLSASGSIESLADIGIKFDDAGKLSVDSAVLNRAIEQDVDAVASLFARDDGLAARLEKLLGGYVDSGGVLEGRTTGLTDRVDDINDQREALTLRLASLEERLLAQFTAMDALVGQLQATGNYLAQQFAALSNVSAQR